MKAVKSGTTDVRHALESSNRRDLVETAPKIVHQSSKTKKVVDTEDKRELSEVQPDGKVITETSRTTQHEEVMTVVKKSIKIVRKLRLFVRYKRKTFVPISKQPLL